MSKLFKSAVEHGMKRNEIVHALKVMRDLKLPLKPIQEEILMKEETLRLKIMFFDKYQIGDPQEIELLYQETGALIDKEIMEYSTNVETTEKSK